MVLKKIRTPIPVAADSDVYKEILYVEDDDDNWELAFLALREWFQLYRAKDSYSAIDLLRKTRYDIVLMDIELSGSQYNGIEITKKIKQEILIPGTGDFEKNRETPIVFVTAYGARYNRTELLEAGASEVVEKPVDFGRLSRVVTKLTLKETYRALSHIRKNYGQ
jgi:CheY-like chemotaxis protein